MKLGVDCRAPAALLCDVFDYTETTEKKMICGMMKEVCAANWQFIDGVDGTQLAKRNQAELHAKVVVRFMYHGLLVKLEAHLCSRLETMKRSFIHPILLCLS